jgi:hypothetical protein
MNAMSLERAKPDAGVPAELFALRQRIMALPATARGELESLIDEVLEEAEYRGRVMAIARDALERFRLDLAATRFDLEATRRERESLRARLGEKGSG